MKKRVIAVLVAMVLCLTCSWAVWADNDDFIDEFVNAEEPAAADEELAADEEQTADGEQTAAEIQNEIPGGNIEESEADLSAMIIQDGGFPQAEQKTKRNTKSLMLGSSDSAREAIYTGLLNRVESIDLSSYNIAADKVYSLYSQVINENPELFYVNSGLSWSYSGNIILTIRPSYADYTEFQINEYNQKVNHIIASIDSSWTDAEKLMYIHDWIVLNCEYDKTYSNHNAYDVIIGGSAVCQGYSLAFSALARKVGINCSVISSQELDHAWNLVEVDGRKYFVDCTWDDPSKGITVVCLHKNFLRSKAGIESTGHTAGDWVDGTTNASAENEAVNSTMYDNCWWISLSRAAALSGENVCYVDEADKTIKRYSFNNGTTENVFKCANDSLPIIGKLGSGRRMGKEVHYTLCISLRITTADPALT